MNELQFKHKELKATQALVNSTGSVVAFTNCSLDELVDSIDITNEIGSGFLLCSVLFKNTLFRIKIAIFRNNILFPKETRYQLFGFSIKMVML